MNWLPSLKPREASLQKHQIHRDRSAMRCRRHQRSPADKSLGRNARPDSALRAVTCRPRISMDHQNRHNRDRQNRRKSDGESLGPRQRPEHSAFLGFEQEHWQKRDHNDQQRKKSGRLPAWRRREAAADARDSSIFSPASSACMLTFRQMPIAILDHDDRCIDQHTDRQRKSTQRHDVRADLQVVHGNERQRAPPAARSRSESRPSGSEIERR